MSDEAAFYHFLINNILEFCHGKELFVESSTVSVVGMIDKLKTHTGFFLMVPMTVSIMSPLGSYLSFLLISSA